MIKSCNICNSEMNPIFTATLLNKYTVQYYQCPDCNYLCTENPFWLEESYQIPINFTDTGILVRNILYSKITSCILFLIFSQKKQYLDYGGGYGIFTRLMRDIGFDFYWFDPFADNLFAKGFEYPSNTEEIELITSFENFEHFVDPVVDLEKIKAISPNILFSTKLLPEPIPRPGDWWYYGFEHGQHVSFYSEKTLQTIADKFGLNYYSFNHDLHLFSRQKISRFSLLLIRKMYWMVFPIIKLQMHSKIFEDMEYLKTGQHP